MWLRGISSLTCNCAKVILKLLGYFYYLPLIKAQWYVLCRFLSHKEKSEPPRAGDKPPLGICGVVWGGNEKKEGAFEHSTFTCIPNHWRGSSMPILTFLRNWVWGKIKNTDFLYLLRKWSFSFAYSRSLQQFLISLPLHLVIELLLKNHLLCEFSPLNLRTRYSFFLWLSTLFWKELRPLPGGYNHVSTFYLLFHLWEQRSHYILKISHSTSNPNSPPHWQLRTGPS